MSDHSLSIVIPAYNEEASLPSFLPGLISFCELHNYFLIIVNDGSKDNTRLVLSNFVSNPTLKVIHHKINKGYGAAIKSGINEAISKYVITIDADGQHNLEDVVALHKLIMSSDADMIVGNRDGGYKEDRYRATGKWLIRNIAKLLLPLHIQDLNSGIKIYDVEKAKQYIRLCPDSMAYSDVIALIFISQRNLVTEAPVTIHPRIAGKSTINIRTAFETLREILNIVILFNPMRIFFPIAAFLFIAGLAWGIPIVLAGRGISVGAMLGITTGILFFFLGLIAEQLGQIRKDFLR